MLWYVATLARCVVVEALDDSDDARARGRLALRTLGVSDNSPIKTVRHATKNDMFHFVTIPEEPQVVIPVFRIIYDDNHEYGVIGKPTYVSAATVLEAVQKTSEKYLPFIRLIQRIN